MKPLYVVYRRLQSPPGEPNTVPVDYLQDSGRWGSLRTAKKLKGWTAANAEAMRHDGNLRVWASPLQDEIKRGTK
jgi:hypothetical protein